MDSKDNKKRKESGQQSEQYSLYTERIVEKPSVKYRRLIRLAETVVGGVVFGIFAAAAFVIVYNYLSVAGAEQNRNKRPGIVIEKDEYPSEMQSAKADEGVQSETQQNAQVPFDGNAADITMAAELSRYEMLQRGIELAGHTIVRVAGNRQYGDNPFEDDSTFSAGVIFAEIDSEYLLLTRYDEVSAASDITVQFGELSEVTGYYVKGDADTGIAIVSIKENDMPASARAYVKTASLGNSYTVVQGSPVIAAGHVMGTDFAVNTGITTNVVNKASLVDAYVGLIYTNMMPVREDYGFLFDLNGNLIGIPVTGADNDVMTFYGISDLKALIEELSNGYTVTYCGIIGENVTSAMAAAYRLPTGVYITSVQENSPAYHAGLQAGDVITSINDEAVLTFSAFSEKIYKLNGGDKATINVKRLGKDDYKDILFSVTLGNKE